MTDEKQITITVPGSKGTCDFASNIKGCRFVGRLWRSKRAHYVLPESQYLKYKDDFKRLGITKSRTQF